MKARSKIFETKKRLSEDTALSSFLLPLTFLFLLGTFPIFIRLFLGLENFGHLNVDIPVLSVPLKDNSLSKLAVPKHHAVGPYTQTVIFTAEELVFGDLQAFTQSLADVRNKFRVPHQDGSPQIDIVLHQMQLWRDESLKRQGIKRDNLLILVPSNEIPMSLVMTATHQFKTLGGFQKVVLGGTLQ